MNYLVMIRKIHFFNVHVAIFCCLAYVNSTTCLAGIDEFLSNAACERWVKCLECAPQQSGRIEIQWKPKKSAQPNISSCWHFENGFVKSESQNGKVKVGISNERYSANLQKNREEFQLISLALMKQANQQQACHLFATSIHFQKGVDANLCFPRMLLAGKLKISEQSVDGPIHQIRLVATEPAKYDVAYIDLSFDENSMPLPISSVVKTSTSHIKTEFSDFVLVNEFLLPLKGESFSWDAEKNDWAPRGISVEYEYHPDEPGDQSQLYLAHYGISEPSTPNYKVADFGRGTSLLKWLAAAGFVVLLLTSIFAWRRKLRV